MFYNTYKETYSFEACVLRPFTKIASTVWYACERALEGFLFECSTRKTDQVIQTRAEKHVCVHEKEKLELHAVLEQDACAMQSKVALQQNSCSYSHQTLATCAVNIYYQINAIFFQFWSRRPTN